MIVALTSTNPNLDIDYIGNYANTNLRDRLLRIEGVGGVQVFGGGNYSMRVWIDPDRAAAHNLTAGEIVQALRSQRSEEHTSELQSLMRNSYAVFCLKKKNKHE